MPEVAYQNPEVDNSGLADTMGHPGDATNALRYIVDAYDGEPLFVLRGRDRAARDTIDHYAALVSPIPGMHAQVMAHHARFVRFAENYPVSMKWPDPYPGWNPV